MARPSSKVHPTIAALHVFLALLGISMTVFVFAWIYLPPHDVHPVDHPLDQLMPSRSSTSATQNQFMVDSVGRSAHLSSQKGHPVLRKPFIYPTNTSAPNYHMVFSTSCSPSQDWQSYVFFYSAWKMKQPGTVTRIASGCKESQVRALTELHEEKIAIMSDRFKVHFAPKCPDTRSKYFNKPFGLRDFLEKVLGYPDNKNDDDIIMIVDPDMMLLRPLTHHFDVSKMSWVTEPVSDAVVHGHPFSQAYGFAASWLTCLGDNKSYVAGPNSPAIKLSIKEASHYYPAGPPYIATARDMYNIAIHWTKFVVRVHDIFPKMMSEMHAYSFAAAHVGLRHQLAYNFMVSDVTMETKEGWGFLHNVKREEACVPDAIPMENLPYVFHFCQRYALGRWFAGKYKVPKKFFDCDQPLLREPPEDAAVRYDWFIYPNGNDVSNMTLRPFRILQNGWAMCRLIRSLNEIVTNYKSKHCDKSVANFAKSHVFHDPKAFEEFLQGNVPNLQQIVDDGGKSLK